MSRIRPIPVPANALLARYLADNPGSTDSGYTDCYIRETPGNVTIETYVEAFYTTWLFRLERWILSLIGRPSSDEQARALARGEATEFAAWYVEDRADQQLLMCDFRDRTRSWLMVQHDAESDQTTLFFGSAVIHQKDGAEPRVSPVFRLLLGFHRIYARSLLAAAERRLRG